MGRRAGLSLKIGETLKARLARGPASTVEAARYVAAIGAALEYAQRQGSCVATSSRRT